MSDAMKRIQNKDDTFSAYDNTYDITIHCKTKEKQKNVIARLESTSWTPVCDRLPEFKKLDVLGSPDVYETEKVLVQTKRGETFVAWCHKTVYTSKKFNDEYLWYVNGTGGRKMKCMSKVIAWMPLPEPYKED